MESGTVLYPCFAVRGTVKVMPGETESVRIVMAFAESRQELEGIIEKLSGKRNFMRAFDFATADSRAEKEYIGIKNGEYAMFGRLLPPVFYGNICGSRYVSPAVRDARTRCGRFGATEYQATGLLFLYLCGTLKTVSLSGVRSGSRFLLR